MHIRAIKHAVLCPTFPDLCTLSEPLESAHMRDHLACVHGTIVKERPKRKRTDKDEDEGE